MNTAIRSKLCVAVWFLSAGCGSAFGQQVISQKALSLDLAQLIARAALDKCRESGYHSTVTVVDTAGLVKVTLRDDGTSPQTIDVSRRKAFTAMVYKRPSSATLKTYQTNPPWPGVEGTIPLGGGVPIFAGREIIGGVGVSGAPGADKEEACADAGVAKAKDILN
jgi:uncharacterized protein GlcG (DUF336 family)